MKEEFIQIKSKEKGLISVVLAGAHGNEKCGIEAFKELLPNIRIEKGQVWFGYGNPQAIKANKRFIESDLNRMFKNNGLLSESDKKSYEYKRAQFLKKYLNKADALLDVHASLTPNSKPFIICEANANKIVKYLPVELVVSGFDRVEPGGADYYMNSINKMGICAECGYFKDSQTVKKAKEIIISFLQAMGHIKKENKLYRQSHIRVYDLYAAKTDKFTLLRPFDDFEEILKGQIIGIDGKKEIRVKKQSVIFFARNRNKIGDEAFLLGERIKKT